jgi:hypothetical protein
MMMNLISFGAESELDNGDQTIIILKFYHQNHSKNYVLLTFGKLEG